jgi:hypothetical protein
VWACGRSSYFQVWNFCVYVTKTLEKRNKPVEDI